MSKPSRYLPPEILDEIVNFLRDELETLRQCCLVSKSWVPRTRKHLFAQIWVEGGIHHKWTSVFPDPEDSPAHYTRKLKVDCTQEDICWIQGFCRVERLILNCVSPYLKTGIIPLTPFRIFATSLKSLSVYSRVLPHSQTFGLIRSLPLLEDLTLAGKDTDKESRGPPTTVSPSTSAALTGALELFMYEGMENTLREMLNLPGGLHFRELQLTWCGRPEFPWVQKLVAACSDTLERLDIQGGIDDEAVLGPINLSRATKLKDIVLRCKSVRCDWIFVTLKTITPKRQGLRIFLHIPYFSNYQRNNPEAIGASDSDMRWSDLDHTLVRLWESHPILLTVVDPSVGEETKGLLEYLLPEATRRGIAKLEDSSFSE